jgi:hypothetical protein
MPGAVAAAIRDAIGREPAPGGSLVWLHRPFGIPLQAVAVAAVALVVVGVALSGGSRLLAQPAQVGVGPERGGEGAGTPDELVVKAPRDAASDAAASRPPASPKGAPSDPTASGIATKVVDTVDPVDAVREGGATDGDSGSSERAVGLDAAAAAVDGGDAGGTSAPNLYGGASLHTIGVRESDLGVVAKLLSRHGAVDGQGRDPAARVAALGPGEHDLAVLLPTASARNAFVADLRRTFASSHTERVVDDGSLSLAGAQVGLKLVVTPYVPSRVQKTRDEP